MGIVFVACIAAFVEGVPSVAMRSTFARTKSTASSRNSSFFPIANRYSIIRCLPRHIQAREVLERSCNSWRSDPIRARDTRSATPSAALVLQAAKKATPPTSVMNSRRLIASPRAQDRAFSEANLARRGNRVEYRAISLKVGWDRGAARMARVAWALLARGASYRAPALAAAPARYGTGAARRSRSTQCPQWRRCAAPSFAGNVFRSTWVDELRTPSASDFDLRAPKSPHSSAPAPPGSNPLAAGLASASGGFAAGWFVSSASPHSSAPAPPGSKPLAAGLASASGGFAAGWFGQLGKAPPSRGATQ